MSVPGSNICYDSNGKPYFCSQGQDPSVNSMGSTPSGMTDANGQPLRANGTAMGSDSTDSSATGQYQPGTGIAGRTRSGGGGGQTTGPSPSDMTGTMGEQNLAPGQWYSNLANNLYGQNTVLADPATGWMTYAQKALGLGPFSSTGEYLGSIIGNPVGLSRAMGNNMTSNAGELAGWTALGGYLGQSNAGFDPVSLIKNTIQQVMGFNPSKSNPNDPGAMLALSLWDPDPSKTVDNITAFLVGDNGILKGIVAPDLFRALQNAMIIAGNNIKQGVITNSQGLETVDKSGGTTAYAGNQFLKLLHGFGVV